MQLQILDVDYVLVNGRPIVRIFGKTESGGTVCAMVDGFLPYFYLHPKADTDIEAVKYELDKNNLSYELVQRWLPVGWHEKPVQMLKITGRDPARIPEIRAWLSRWGTPYEADVLFKYRYMVDHGLRGMGWIEVDGKPVHTTTVKCRAIEASSIKPIERLGNAPLRCLAFDIECDNPAGLPNPETDQIIIISLAFDPEWRGKRQAVLLAKPTPLDGCISCDSETEMLKRFLDIIHDYDPDILTGYNIENFDLAYILRRLEVLKLPRDIGRSEKQAFTKKLQHTQRTVITGRVVIDPYYIIRHLSVYDQPLRLKRYDLRTVAATVLGAEKLEMGGAAEIARLWSGSAADLQRLIEYSRRDVELALQLVTSKKFIDIDKFAEIAKVSGLLFQDVMAGQAARHESALLHELRSRGFVMPCKPSTSEVRQRASLQLKGALVLEPEVGLHTDGCVLVLDFTALYPSLIYAKNICPTTLLPNGLELEAITAPNGARFAAKTVREGILPAVARYYLDTRREIRRQMCSERDPHLIHILNAKQYALKGMSVSLYGFTAFAAGRFFVPDVAAAITAWGRDTIARAKELIETNFNVKVIYSDTDSTFIKTQLTDLDAAIALGDKISNFVTARLPGLELKFEKAFKSFLIEAKKRYAGWAFERTANGWRDYIEMKGIETVRRDWCVLVSEVMLAVLNMILKERDIRKAVRYVRDVIHDLAKGTIPLEKLVIVKGITKEIERYDGVQPHVELARKIMARDPTRQSFVGERLEYVIVKGNALLSKRAEDPEYVKKKGLEIDAQYYIENQLMPPLERIFEVCGVSRQELLEGTRQQSLLDLLASRAPSPDKTVLPTFDAIVCAGCRWSGRLPTLRGVCPTCGGQLYFSHGGTIGRFLKL